MVRRWSRTVVLAAAAAAVTLAVDPGFAWADNNPAGTTPWAPAPPRWAGAGASRPMAYSSLLHALHRRRVRRAIIDTSSNSVLIQLADGSRRIVAYPPVEPIAGLLSRSGATVRVGRVARTSGGSAGEVAAILLIVLVGLAAGAVVLTRLNARRSDAPPAPPGQSAPMARRTMSSVRFSDVAGCDEAVLELADTIEFLRNP